MLSAGAGEGPLGRPLRAAGVLGWPVRSRGRGGLGVEGWCCVGCVSVGGAGWRCDGVVGGQPLWARRGALAASRVGQPAIATIEATRSATAGALTDDEVVARVERNAGSYPQRSRLADLLADLDGEPMVLR